MSACRPVQDRLWDRLEINGISECWEWTGHKLRGYGQIGLGRRCHGLIYTHVLAWIIENGKDVPPGMLVCHACDNRSCCNPAHLFLGTPKENTQDMVSKGRHAYGERHATKLTENSVRQIKKLAAIGVPHRKIATEYGVSRSMVQRISNGQRWSHV